MLDASGVTPLTEAKATAYGSIKTITLDNAGSGYSFPTVDIDYPDAPDGVQATRARGLRRGELRPGH